MGSSIENAAETGVPPRGLAAGWRNARHLLPGIALVGVLACIAMWMADLGWMRRYGLGALTLAIVLGMLIGNTLYPKLGTKSAAGVGFSKQRLLRLGIVLYGFRLTFQDIGHVGMVGVLIDALVLSSTFVLAWIAGRRLFGLDRETVMLIGAGSSICGAAAVMAVAPVVRGRAEQVTVAVSTVVVFGTLAMFLYPLLYRINLHWQWLPVTADAFGIFTGSTVHEVAQVVVAGRAAGDDAGNIAVIAKMVRVMMLAPFLVLLSACLSRSAASRRNGGEGAASTGGIAIPWFALGFIAVAGLNSLTLLPAPVVNALVWLDTVLLTMAMMALGLTTHASAIRQAGIRPLALAALLLVWLIGGGLLINAGLHRLMG
ncbi:MAG: YeiH family protein [Xanthomonadaceae bacterium]|jgi:uncharacterized integral membrane protein (TIGR00698 family)|nr:YeiH family protein [Xanthomonadaceae bacterium]